MGYKNNNDNRANKDNNRYKESENNLEEKEKIGGRAYSNGVMLMNNSHSVKAYYDKNNHLKVRVAKVKKSKYLLYFKKIPVLRGIISLFFAVKMFLQEGLNKPKKYWFLFLILFIEIVYWFLPPNIGTGITNLLLFAYIAIPLILLLKFKKIISDTLKYHGAEHKTVHYYEGNCQGDIASYSRLHKRCGSNVVFYYILISFSLGFFIFINNFLLEIVYLGIAFETIRYTPKSLLFFPYLFQRIVTREPEQKHIEAAKMALNVLINQKTN